MLKTAGMADWGKLPAFALGAVEALEKSLKDYGFSDMTVTLHLEHVEVAIQREPSVKHPTGVVYTSLFYGTRDRMESQKFWSDLVNSVKFQAGVAP